MLKVVDDDLLDGKSLTFEINRVIAVNNHILKRGVTVDFYEVLSHFNIIPKNATGHWIPTKLINFENDFKKEILRYIRLINMDSIIYHGNQKIYIFENCNRLIRRMLESGHQSLSIEFLYIMSQLNYTFYGQSAETLNQLLHEYIQELDKGKLCINPRD